MAYLQILPPPPVQKTARGACCSSRGRINVVWGGKNLFCVLQKVKVTKLAGAIGISNATQIKLSLVIRSSLVWLSGLVATACAKRRNSAIADKPRDAFTGQSRSPNMVPLHMLGMVSYQCAIAILSLRRARFQIIDFKKCRDLEIWVRGPLRSLKVIHSIDYM